MVNIKYPLLDQIENVSDLKSLSIDQLPQLCDELRSFLIYSISQSSGHFASNLGTVELTVALHYVFSSPTDKLIWDVGHQAYAHKVLTGRKDRISTIRKYKGLHPFPYRKESEHDILSVGHSSTSISMALGLSIAQTLSGQKGDIVPIIGDGALTAGMAFEALNHAGDIKLPMTIIFNDNNMSISTNKGAMNRHTDRIFKSQIYQTFREKGKDLLPNIEPLRKFFKNTENAFKNLLSPPIAQLFNTLGVDYIGPIDGHDVKALVQQFQKIYHNGKLQIVHIYTTKGKGYLPAEQDPIKFHGVSKFEPEVDKVVQSAPNSTSSNLNSEQVSTTVSPTVEAGSVRADDSANNLNTSINFNSNSDSNSNSNSKLNEILNSTNRDNSTTPTTDNTGSLTNSYSLDNDQSLSYNQQANSVIGNQTLNATVDTARKEANIDQLGSNTDVVNNSSLNYTNSQVSTEPDTKAQFSSDLDVKSEYKDPNHHTRDFSISKATCMDKKREKVELVPVTTKKNLTYSQVFGKWLVDHKDDPRLVAITPAMGEGSGMVEFANKAPEKFIDVAIAEQHSVTLSTGLAIGGFKPIVAIYSTFMQRAYDQVIHDVALDNHDVLFAIDRGGIVGEDGETHQGAFDLSYLRCVPNIVLMTPATAELTTEMLTLGYEHQGSAAIRYPRGASTTNQDLIDLVAQEPSLADQLESFVTSLNSKVVLGKGVQLLSAYLPNTTKFLADNNLSNLPKLNQLSKGIAIVSVGTMLKRAVPLAIETGAALFDLRFVKPIDQDLIKKLEDFDVVVILEENATMGGAGSAVREVMADLDIFRPSLNIGIPDHFIEPIDTKRIDEIMGWDQTGLRASLLSKLKTYQ